MTYPRTIDCPKCGADGDTLSVYTYDSGWRYVECDTCWHRSPGEGSILQAIRSHNRTAPEMKAQYQTARERVAAP